MLRHSFGYSLEEVGTIFSVEVAKENEPVKVRVLRGVVKVRTSDAQERTLRAHQSLALGLAAPVDLAASEETNDLALLRMDPEGPPEPVQAAGEELKAPAGSAAQDTRLPAAERSSPALPESLGPGELLRQALEHRAQSRFAEAARVYRKLVAAHPGSAEGRAALVSLGDLQLSRLQDAGAALRSFDAYLASGDRGLKQEAEYGRIRALRALGRPLDEQRAIERLLLSYPSGVHAEPMRARLQSLKGDAGR